MATNGSDAAQEQREYYRQTALRYDEMHVNRIDEHAKALGAFMGLADTVGPVESVLDVGAGTGRALTILKKRWPKIRALGVEPVEALRRAGHAKGISSADLIAGDALKLPFDDDSFDYVIETGVLHHIATPLIAVAEMARVARKGVMISDSNNIGQGRANARLAKYLIKSLGLWKIAIWIQTGGKNYKKSEGDGIYYSFSVFDCVSVVSEKFTNVHFMNTSKSYGLNMYKDASHIMMLATRE